MKKDPPGIRYCVKGSDVVCGFPGPCCLDLTQKALDKMDRERKLQKRAKRWS